MAAGNMKTIKRRIKSVGSTMQITKAMELVASSKLRKAKQKEKEALPYFVAEERMLTNLFMLDKKIIDDTEYAGHKGHEKDKVENSLYIVIAGNKGLAGGYNSNVFKKVATHMSKLPEKPKVIAIGKKAIDYFEKRDFEVIHALNDAVEDIKSGHCSAIANTAIELFTRQHDAVDEVKLFYTQYVSTMTQKTAVMQLLPFVSSSAVEDDDYDALNDIFAKARAKAKKIEEAKKKGGAKDSGEQIRHIPTIFDPEPQAVLKRIIPNLMSGVIQSAITESYASELSARQVAMESASDNAEEMIEKLSLLYNRARQEKITNEINEIVGGANAL
jgi:F-type H+-transporting ATPase subunit gamma